MPLDMHLDYNQVIVDIILVNYDFIHSQWYQHIEDNIQFTQILEMRLLLCVDRRTNFDLKSCSWKQKNFKYFKWLKTKSTGMDAYNCFLENISSILFFYKINKSLTNMCDIHWDHSLSVIHKFFHVCHSICDFVLCLLFVFFLLLKNKF